jgi:7-carboxy-7-deazaguanine synthase
MENSNVKAGTSLPIMEHFATIQGEGFHSGKAAYFIRLAGCDVGCHWCDVKDSWDASLHPTMQVDDIVKQVLNSGLRICVVTGGEPSLYNLEPLTTALKAKGIATHIETSGTNQLLGTWDWITY